MKNTESTTTTDRMLHIRLPEPTHRRVRIAAARRGITIQEFVATFVEREMNSLGKEELVCESTEETS